MYKPALLAGAISGALAVMLGAFGAHALKARLSADQLNVFETGVRYQFYHSFALLLTGIIYLSFPQGMLRQASVMFIIGIALFSGSLYAMTVFALSGQTIGRAGIITPIGGVFFILGWLFLFYGVFKSK